jgi:hypothetical protein
MPYEVTVSGQVRVPRTCGTCGEWWVEAFNVTSTSGPMWRSGVKGAARSMQNSIEATAEGGAPERGHVCPFCAHLSVQALATTFKDGIGPAILRIYDASLEEPAGILSMVGCVFGVLLLVPAPLAGVPLLAVSLPFQIRTRRRLKACRAFRPHAEKRLGELRFHREWLERVAVRAALAGSKYPHGDFEPRLAWCWTVRQEIEKVDRDPSLLPTPKLPTFSDLFGRH